MSKEEQETSISSTLTQLLDSNTYIRKDIGEIKGHLSTQNHRLDKLEVQNIKEVTRAKVNKEWQDKDNQRTREESKVSKFWITTVLSLMTLIASGTAIIVTQLL